MKLYRKLVTRTLIFCYFQSVKIRINCSTWPFCWDMYLFPVYNCFVLLMSLLLFLWDVTTSSTLFARLNPELLGTGNLSLPVCILVAKRAQGCHTKAVMNITRVLRYFLHRKDNDICLLLTNLKPFIAELNTL